MPSTLHPELAKAALVFLARSQLHGVEVSAFNAVVAALEEFANPPPLPAPEGEKDANSS
jgi:hypothetical protein